MMVSVRDGQMRICKVRTYILMKAQWKKLRCEGWQEKGTLRCGT